MLVDMPAKHTCPHTFYCTCQCPHNNSIFTHPVLVDVDVPEVGVVHQLVRLYVDGGLTAPPLTHVPVRVDQTPELRTWRGAAKQRGEWQHGRETQSTWARTRGCKKEGKRLEGFATWDQRSEWGGNGKGLVRIPSKALGQLGSRVNLFQCDGRNLYAVNEIQWSRLF